MAPEDLDCDLTSNTLNGGFPPAHGLPGRWLPQSKAVCYSPLTRPCLHGVAQGRCPRMSSVGKKRTEDDVSAGCSFPRGWAPFPAPRSHPSAPSTRLRSVDLSLGWTDGDSCTLHSRDLRHGHRRCLEGTGLPRCPGRLVHGQARRAVAPGALTGSQVQPSAQWVTSGL